MLYLSAKLLYKGDKKVERDRRGVVFIIGELVLEERRGRGGLQHIVLVL
jgi:hypothetical protein